MRTFLKRRVKDTSLFFCFLSNTVYLNKRSVWVKQSLPRSVFVFSKVKPLTSSISLKFFYTKNEFWRLFWKIFNFHFVLETGFFAELELIGLGFRIRKISSKVYRFFWGHSNFVYLFVPNDLLVEYSPDDRLIFFFGFSAALVNGFSTYLMLLKRLSSYRITGFVRPGVVIRLNSGKQR